MAQLQSEMRTNSGRKLMLAMLLCLGLSGCIGKVVGAVVDTTIEIAKVPFKVGGAVIDVVKGDDDEKDDKNKDEEK